jgi:hypothetical protein
VTSAGYGSARHILCAYIAAGEPIHGEYNVEAMGERYPGAHRAAAVRPRRKAILG